MRFYGYEGNLNLSVSKVCEEHCEWVTENWQCVCSKSGKPGCSKLQSLTPESVFEHIKPLLEEDAQNVSD